MVASSGSVNATPSADATAFSGAAPSTITEPLWARVELVLDLADEVPSTGELTEPVAVDAVITGTHAPVWPSLALPQPACVGHIAGPIARQPGKEKPCRHSSSEWNRVLRNG